MGALEIAIGLGALEIAMLAAVVFLIIAISALLTFLIIKIIDKDEKAPQFKGKVKEEYTLESPPASPVLKPKGLSPLKPKSQAADPELAAAIAASLAETGATPIDTKQSQSTTPSVTPSIAPPMPKRPYSIEAGRADPLSNPEPSRAQYEAAKQIVAAQFKINRGTQEHPVDFSIHNMVDNTVGGVTYAGLEQNSQDAVAAYRAVLAPIKKQYLLRALQSKAAGLGLAPTQTSLTPEERQATEVQAENSPEVQREKQAMVLAADRSRAFVERYTRAYAAAIREYHNTDAFFSINGYCHKRIKDVGVMNNNCGFNVLLQVVI